MTCPDDRLKFAAAAPNQEIAMPSKHIHTFNSARSVRPLAHALAAALTAVGLAGLTALGAAGSAHAQGQRRPAPTPKPVCLIADFRSLSLQTHDPRERAAQTRDWLRANGSACTAAQLGTLASNRAAWLGNADSPALMGMIDGMIETLEAKQASAATAAAASSVKTAASTASDTVTAGTSPPRTAGAPNSAGTQIAPVVVPVAVPNPASAAPPKP